MHGLRPEPRLQEPRDRRLSYEVSTDERALSQRVMHELVAQPLPFAELKLLGPGKHPRELTDALLRLEEDGLIGRRTSQRQVPIVHTYELTPLGAQAEREMQRLRPLGDVPRKVPRRQRSGMGGARSGDPRWMADAE